MKSLRLIAGARLRAWAARRHGPDALPLAIHVRRIYILPTGLGLVLAALVVAMLLAGLNYNSNLGLAFAFLMASIALVAMHHCHRNLLGLRVDADAQAEGLVGAAAELRFLLENDSRVDRYDVEIRCAPGAAAMHGVPAGSARLVPVPMPLARRGVTRLRQFEICTTYPLGWFRAWTYVQAPLTVYAAPQPGGERPLPPAASKDGGAFNAAVRGDEEFVGLGAYAPGIALKHMAWKVLARGGEAAVRNYADPSAAPYWLDWRALDGLGSEARLAQLCRWVLDSDAARRPYGLRMPGIELGPAQGPAHRSACLRALAGFEVREAR